MRIWMIANRRAGRGRGERLARAFHAALARDGHDATLDFVGDLPAQPLDAQLMVVLGGDGTLHYALPAAAASGAALYHVPLGTENLVPREFGYDRRISTLRGAIDAGRYAPIDLGECNGTPFVVMCSVGPDANVIHRVSAARSGGIRRLSYVMPILRETMRPGLTPMTLEVDGRTLVAGRCGVAVVANCRQYGFRLDPAPMASLRDGLLDVVFLPCGGTLGMLAWMLRTRLRRHLSSAEALHAAGREVRIVGAGGPLAWQMDGEPYGAYGTLGAEASAGELRLRVRERAVRMLLPADGGAG